MSRPSKTSSRKAWTAPSMPSSVKCSVRPVAMSVLKSMGPTRSVCTVLSVNWRAKRLGRPGLLVEDAAEDRGGELALGGAGGARHQHVLARQGQ
jgi:hypothetical protein